MLAIINNPAVVAAVAIVIGTVFAWLLVDAD